MPETRLVAALAADFRQANPWYWPSPLTDAGAAQVNAALARLRPTYPDLPERVDSGFRARFRAQLSAGQGLGEDLRAFTVRCWAAGMKKPDAR